MAKTRTIIARMTVEAGTFTVNSVDNPAPGRQHWMDMALPALGWTAFGMFGFSWRVTWSGAPGSIAFVGRLTLTLPSGPFSGYTQSDDAAIGTLATGGSLALALAGGTISVTAQVEEVEETLTETTFSSTFGPSIAHGPKRTTKIFRERVRAGTNIEIAATIGGATISETIPIDGTNQFYLDNLDNAGTSDWAGYALSQSADHRSLPIGGTVTIESELELDGVVVPLSCAFVGSDHGHSVGGASVSAVSPSGTRELDIHRTTAQTQIWVPREWALYAYFRAMEEAYPSAVDARVDRKAGDTNALVSCPADGSQADTETQERYAASGSFSDSSYAAGPYVGDETQSENGVSLIAWSTAGIAQPTALAVDEFADFQCGLDADWILASAEETEDWRLPVLLGASEEVGTLTHETDYAVDIGTAADWDAGANTTLTDSGGYIEIAAAGGAGSAAFVFDLPDREYPPYDDWQAGQQIELVLQYDTAGQEFTLAVNDTEHAKEWEDSLPSANTDTTLTFDLRGPHNAPVTTDATQSRYYDEGWFFGVNKAVSLTLSGIPDGRTLRVKTIIVRRKDRSRVCFGLPTRPWLPNNVGSNYLRHVVAESYKVALEIAGMTQVITSGHYTYPTLQDFFDNIADFHPGWSAISSATAAELLLPLMWLGGLFGVRWNGTAFVSGVDADARTSTVLAVAESADVIRWYPRMGEIRGAFGQVTPMRTGKVLRGRIGAVVIDPTTHAGASGVGVTFSGGASAAETVTTDAEGLALSEPRKFGTGTAQVGGNTVNVSVYNRWVAWSGFSDTTETEGCTSGLSMDFSPGLRFVRACNEDGTIRLHFATDAGRLVFEDVDTGIAGEVREVRWERLSGEMRLFVSYTDGSDLAQLVETRDEGSTASMAVQLSTEVVTQQTMAIGENKIIYSYWRTAAGALKGKLLNFAGDTLLPRPDETGLLADGFTVVATGVEDVDIACAVAPGEEGQFLVKLGYYGASGLVQVSSVDGRVFA